MFTSLKEPLFFILFFQLCQFYLKILPVEIIPVHKYPRPVFRRKIALLSPDRDRQVFHRQSHIRNLRDIRYVCRCTRWNCPARPDIFCPSSTQCCPWAYDRTWRYIHRYLQRKSSQYPSSPACNIGPLPGHPDGKSWHGQTDISFPPAPVPSVAAVP